MSDALRFTVYFDGTGNNKDRDTPEGRQTNVARLYELDTANGTNLARNSGHALQQYDAHERSGQSEKIYFDGVGSQANITPRFVLEAGTGLGGQERIDQAYDAIVAFHNKYPEQKVDVNIVGFSRGAAQSRALANEFIERGVPKLDNQGRSTGDFLIPPGQAHVNKLAIFDTVASYGNAMSDTHLGKNLEIGKNVDSTTHLVAMNEYRETFRLTSALRNDDNSRIEELKFAGAHSQVGGGYRNDVLAAGPLAVMYDRLQSAGIEMRLMRQEDMQRIEQYNELIKSPEKVQEALIDSRLKEGNEAFTRGADGSFQTVNNTPFAMERGTINVFARQNRPFEHQINGRGVIFENDDVLSKSKIQRGVEAVGDWFAEVGDKLKDRAAQFFGLDRRAERAAAQEQNSFDEQLQEIQQAWALDRGSELEGSLSTSRPNSQYIDGLNLQPVPMPSSAVQDQQPAPHPSAVQAKIAEFEEISRNYKNEEPGMDSIIRKGTLIDAELRHEAFASKAMTPDQIKEIATQDLEAYSFLQGKPEQQKLAVLMGGMMDEPDYRSTIHENPALNLDISIAAASSIERQAEVTKTHDQTRDAQLRPTDPLPLRFTHQGQPATLNLDRFTAPEQRLSPSVAAKVAELQSVNERSADEPDVMAEIVSRGTVADATMRHDGIRDGSADRNAIREAARQDLVAFADLDGRPEQQQLAREIGSMMANPDYRDYMASHAPESVSLTIKATQAMDSARVISKEKEADKSMEL